MNVRESVKQQINQYLLDIEEIAEQMEKQKNPMIRGLQQESIKFKIGKIRERLKYL